MENIQKDTNFAKAFYFFAFMFLVVYALNSLSAILTPIAIAILIWFLINALASQIKRLPFLSPKVADIVAIPLSLIFIVYFMIEIGSFITSSMMSLSSTISQLDGKVNALFVLGTGFHPEFSGRENIKSSLAFQGITGAEALILEKEIIEFSELEDFI
ncbi:MAG: hypothetical protein IE890_12280, partial [Arcobacter sp.]|nr:hypothetical protein [Arcobacter sp.]